MHYPRYEFEIPREQDRCRPRPRPELPRRTARPMRRPQLTRRRSRAQIDIHEYLELEFAVDDRR